MQVNPTTFPISWFRDRSVDGTLILKPPYQRKPVWKKSQKAYLIDTIIKEYQVPEIYIHRVTSRDGETTYNVVDGQQRIRTILEFVDGNFSLDESYTPEYPNLYFNDLPDKIKQNFWGYVITVREISRATEDDVRQFFKRMNRNVVALNAQELRHATYSGDFIKLMEELAEDPFWTENKIVTPNEVRRMNDVQYISELFVSMMNGIQDKSKDLDSYYDKYETAFTDKPIWNERFLIIKAFIEDLLPQLRDTRWRNKPDFYTLFLSLNDLLGKKKGFSISVKDKKKLSGELVDFAQHVALIVSRESRPKGITRPQKDYAAAVSKATTDKNSRVIRHRIVLKMLGKYL